MIVLLLMLLSFLVVPAHATLTAPLSAAQIPPLAYLGDNALAQTVSVDKSGNDSSCAIGRIDLPCLTVNKAMSLITDSSVSKNYVIKVGPGSFVETSLALKPYVAIYGHGDLYGGSTAIELSSGAITIDSSAATVAGRYGLFNLTLGNSASLNLDFQAIGGVQSEVVEMHNVSVDGNLVFKGKNANDFFSIDDSFVHGTTTLSGGTCGVSNVNAVGNVQFDTSGSSPITVLGVGLISYNDLRVTSSGGKVAVCQLYASGTTTVHVDTANAYLYADVGSLPSPQANLTVTSSGNVVPTAESYGVSYTPILAANWAAAPATVSSALDKLVVLQQSASGSQPTCSSANRGLSWLIQGGAGVADIYQVCQKNSSDTYAWVTH